MSTLLPPPADVAERPSARSAALSALRSGEAGYVHSWELVTAVDGPGTRMTIFLSGCPLRCQYCHNPDTWVKRDGTRSTAEEMIARIRRYRHVFTRTGGGVTISGGEPLLQAEFVERIFRACRAEGIPTALDTSGFLGRRASDALVEATDLVLLDVKSGDEDTYRHVTGRPLAPTLAFGDRLNASGTRIWVRFVLVPGLTDSEENVDAVARIVAGWQTVDRVEVLPFHQLGAAKWAARGLPYTLSDVRPPDGPLLERVRAQFRARGLTVF